MLTLHTTIIISILIAIQALSIFYLIREISGLSSLVDSALSGSATFQGPVAAGTMGPDITSFIDMRTEHPVGAACFRGKPTVLFFISVTCPNCRWLVKDVSKQLASFRHDDLAHLIVVCQGPRRACFDICGKLISSVSTVYLEDDIQARNIASSFHFAAFPVIVKMNETWEVLYTRYPSKVEHILKCMRSETLPQSTPMNYADAR